MTLPSTRPVGLEDSAQPTCLSSNGALERTNHALKVSLLVTCLGDALFPDVGVATVRLLRRLGVEVDFPQSQTCCGQPHFNSGYRADARDLAKHTISAFSNGKQMVTPTG